MKNTVQNFIGCLIVLGLGLPQVVNSQQIGPGGVGNSTNIALWLDAADLDATLNDGDNVATWADKSGNGNDFAQGTPGDQPTWVESSDLNSFPAVNFNGSTQFLERSNISMLDNTRYTFFIASKVPTQYSIPANTNACLIDVDYVGVTNRYWTVKYRKQGTTSGRVFGASKSNGASPYVTPVTAFSVSGLADVRTISYRHLSTNVVRIDNNELNATASPADAAIGVSETIRIGENNGGGQNFVGVMNDIVIYNETLNDAQMVLVRNYYSSKYGTNIGAADRYSYDGTHSNDLAGIGREDASNEHLSARGTGIVTVTSLSLGNSDYFIWADDDAGYAVTTTNRPAGYVATNGNMFTQTWRVAEPNGDVGALTIAFDLTGIEFGDGSQYELLVDGDGDFSDATRHTGVYAAGVVTFSLAGGDISDGNYFTLGNTQEKIISIVDGQDWNVTSTWSCDCIPGTGNDVSIEDGHTVTITDAQEIDAFDIQTTGALVMDAGGELTLNGNMNVIGSLTSNSGGKLIMSGGAAQTIDGGVTTVALDTIEVDNTNGVTFNSGSYSISGMVLPTDGTIDFNGRPFTFLSTASGTGMIGPYGAGGGVSNLSNTTVQRFVAAGNAGNRNMGVPFLSSFTMREWDPYIYISGPGFPDGCAQSASGCYKSVKYYDATNQIWKSLADLDSTINSGSGFEIFLGDNLSTFSATTLEDNSSTVYVAASKDVTLKEGWNFVANPFLCTIDYDNVTRSDAVNTGNYFWVYDAGSGGYQYWDGDVLPAGEASIASLAGGKISPFQGFWVYHDDAADATLTFDQSSKSLANEAFVKKASIGAVLSISDLNSNRKFDVRFGSNDRVSVPRLPANKEGLQMYIQSAEGNKVVQSLDLNGDCYKFILGFDNVTDGDYKINLEDMFYSHQWTLIDTKTGVEYELSEVGSVNLTLEEGDVNNRFELILSKSATCFEDAGSDVNAYVSHDDFVIQLDNYSADVERISVYSIAGELIATYVNIDEGNGVRVKLPQNLKTGIYLYEVVLSDNTVVLDKVVFQKP